jgi:hypothetical protein
MTGPREIRGTLHMKKEKTLSLVFLHTAIERTDAARSQVLKMIGQSSGNTPDTAELENALDLLNGALVCVRTAFGKINATETQSEPEEVSCAPG